MLSDDESSAQEADSRDDLGRHPGRIEGDIGPEHVEKSVLAHHQEDRGGDSDDRLGAHAGALAADIALEPDERGEHEGEQQLTDL